MHVELTPLHVLAGNPPGFPEPLPQARFADGRFAPV